MVQGDQPARLSGFELSLGIILQSEFGTIGTTSQQI